MSAEVTLRRVSMADADQIYRWRSEPSVREFQPLEQVPVDVLMERLRHRAEHPIDPNLTGEAQWVIVAGGQDVGWVGLEVTSRKHGIGSVGYTIAAEFRGYGYATAGVRALLPLAFPRDRANLFRLEAVAAAENLASRRVLTKAGFTEEGIARAYLVIGGVRVDHVRFALLRTEWETVTRP